MPTLPGLLLFHGVGDDGRCWAPFVRRLRGCPGLGELAVATPDAPAHGGRRAEPGRSIAWPDLLGEAIDHAQTLVAATGGPIVVAGHSMGAMMALGVAGTRPDLVAAIFLEDPPLAQALPDSGAVPPAASAVDVSEFGQWFAELQAVPLDDVVAGARHEHPTWDDDEYERWARAKQLVDTTAFDQPVHWIHDETESLLRRTRGPVVVAAGLPDRGGLVAESAAASLTSLPGWTLHRLPTGHDVRRDAPAATVALLADLIRSAAR